MIGVERFSFLLGTRRMIESPVVIVTTYSLSNIPIAGLTPGVTTGINYYENATSTNPDPSVRSTPKVQKVIADDAGQGWNFDSYINDSGPPKCETPGTVTGPSAVAASDFPFKRTTTTKTQYSFFTQIEKVQQ